MIFSHYRGGLYRKLLVARLVPSAHIWTPLVILSDVRHSDDRTRVLQLVIDHDENARYVGPVLVDMDPQRMSTDEDRAAVHINHVVYVSLRYGKVWARPEAEFSGNVTVNGERLLRFANVDSADTYASALDVAAAACRGVADSRSDVSEASAYNDGYADGASFCAKLLKGLVDRVAQAADKS